MGRASVGGMPYPAPFHRIVAIGTLYSDVFNFSLSIIPRTGTGIIGLPPAADMLDPVTTAIRTWFGDSTASGGLSISSSAKLTSVKVNAIGTDGLYADNETNELILTTPEAGGGTAGIPPQLSIAATLRTAVPRGAGSKGRFYPPPSALCVGLGTDGRITAANAALYATGVKTLLDAINAQYALAESGDEATGRVGVASNVGGGVFREATTVSIGRTVDTIRSRRNRIPEDYQDTALAP